DPDAIFAGWVGGCEGQIECVVAVDGTRFVTAIFRHGVPRNQIVVTTTAQVGGAGECSLADAIRAANADAPVNGCAAGAGADTIVVPAGTYTLTVAGASGNFGPTGLPPVYSDVVIQGAGAD